jgi:hypothetical protein
MGTPGALCYNQLRFAILLPVENVPLGLVALILKYALLVGVLAYVVSVLRAMIVTMPTADGARPRKPAPAQPPAAKPKPQPQPAAVQPPPAVLEPPAEPVDAQPEPIPAAIPEPGPRPVAAPLPFPVEVEGTSSAPVLVVDDPGDSHLVAGAAVHLGHGLHIGRAPENDLVLDSPAISRQHAYIGPRADAWLLVDKGSANGTFVNGRRVTGPQELHDGDVVTLGDLVFVLSLSGGGRSG